MTKKANKDNATIDSTIHDAISGTIVTVGQNAFTDAKKALQRISLREQKSLTDWLTFGKTWKEVRDYSNGHHVTMNKIRLALFSDIQGRPLVSAHDASYAAKLVDDWYDIEYYTAEVAPHSANPRVVVQGFQAWVTMRLRWGTAFVEEIFSKGEKAAIMKAYKAIGKEQEILAIQAAAKSAEEKQGDKSNGVTPETVKAATDKVAKKNKKAADKVKETSAATAKGEVVRREAMSVNEAISRLTKIQPLLIAAINSGELKGADLDEVDRQVSAIKRSIRRALESAPKVDNKKAA